MFDVEKEYGGKNGMEKKIYAREDGRQGEKGQTSNDLVPGFDRMDQAGHC